MKKVTIPRSLCKGRMTMPECIYRAKMKQSKFKTLFCGVGCLAKSSSARAKERAVTVECGICKKPIYLSRGDHTRRIKQTKSGKFFCGIRCLSKWKENKASRRCRICGNVFYGMKSLIDQKKYCSGSCRRENGKARFISKCCAECGALFTRLTCIDRPKKFCSRQCYRKFLIARRIKRKCFMCNEEVKGKRPSSRSRVFCSVSCRMNLIKANRLKTLGKKCGLCSQVFVARTKRERASRVYCSQKCALRSQGQTKPEKAVRDILRRLKISTSISKNPLRNFTFPDFVLNKQKTCIYVDGTYWHKNKEKKDALQSKVLRAAGYRVIRIPEAKVKNVISLERRLARALVGP